MALTPAEKQARYRAKQTDFGNAEEPVRVTDGNESVTKVTPSVTVEDDPIVGLSSITARYAITRSGKLISTTLLSEEQMLAGGIWLGPDPADSDFKAEKVKKK